MEAMIKCLGTFLVIKAVAADQKRTVRAATAHESFHVGKAAQSLILCSFHLTMTCFERTFKDFNPFVSYLYNKIAFNCRINLEMS